jgi:hypothetical protein
MAIVALSVWEKFTSVVMMKKLHQSSSFTSRDELATVGDWQGEIRNQLESTLVIFQRKRRPVIV